MSQALKEKLISHFKESLGVDVISIDSPRTEFKRTKIHTEKRRIYINNEIQWHSTDFLSAVVEHLEWNTNIRKCNTIFIHKFHKIAEECDEDGNITFRTYLLEASFNDFRAYSDRKGFEEYLENSEVTEAKFPDGMNLDSFQAEILHHLLGISTESGELLDALKKHLIYGKELDLVNIQEEIGDLFWYIAGVLRLLDVDPFYIMDTNIEKLKARYGDKFDAHNALNRDLNTERSILEGDKQ